jgi:twitching motility protein PilT
MSLVKQNLVTYEEALKNVSNPDDFALRFRGIASTSDSSWSDFAGAEDEKPDEETVDTATNSDEFNIDRF